MLIPEVPFTIKGDNGLFKYLDGVLEKKGHCVVCVAEGAGQVTDTRHCSRHIQRCCCQDFWSHISYAALLFLPHAISCNQAR